jgi:hypothetical protein
VVRDAQRDRRHEREPRTPGEGDGIDAELLDCLEAKRSGPRLQDHFANLCDPHGTHRKPRFGQDRLDVPANRLG